MAPRPGAGRLLDRLAVRLRVTLAYTLVMALLLGAGGLFLYLRVGGALTDAVDGGLRSRAGDITALVQQADSGLDASGRSPLTERGENLAQILDRSGRILDATPAVRRVRLLSARQVRQATAGTIVTERRSPAGEPEKLRILATPATAQHRRIVVVVAVSLEATDQARHAIGGQLLVGTPILLLIAALAGYGAAAAALRPVESMRRRVQGMHARQLGRRLPVPAVSDEVSRLGQTLNDLLARLEDAFARERAFVADASHELRTPLTILKGELELALHHAATVPEYHAAVTSAAEETDRLVQLAEDLLITARAEQGRLPISRRPVAAQELLDTVAQRFARRAADHGATITVVVEDGLELDVDRLRMEQALGNLVDNALRHGGPQIRLLADANAILVLDDGRGFPPEFLAHAFERFTRADSARGRGGTGLGLAITAAIVDAHDGTITASNAAHGGAAIRITLPGAEET